MKILSQLNYKNQIWKNGKGLTKEIAILPSHAVFSQCNFIWRFSSADVVEDNTFSLFPGYTRLLTLACEGRIQLNFVDKAEGRTIALGEIAKFSGDESVACNLLAGPIKDLNFIYDETKCSASMVFVKLSATFTTLLANGEIQFLYLLEGSAVVKEKNKQTQVVLLKHDTLQNMNGMDIEIKGVSNNASGILICINNVSMLTKHQHTDILLSKPQKA